MKKTSFFIAVLALMSSFAQAQDANMDFIPFHNTGYDISQFISKPMQQRDGSIVANIILGSVDGDKSVLSTLEGYLYYKVSPSGLQFFDSVLVTDALPSPYYLFAQDPRGEGNLRVNIEPDGNGGTALRISRFSDNDLYINHNEDVLAPLYDSTSFDYINSYMMDSQGDLILKYYSQTPNGNIVCHIARCGVDGTVKHNTELPSSQNFIMTLDEFESNPKHYYQWKKGSDGNLYVYYLDSTFQVTRQRIINHELKNIFYGDPLYMQVMEDYIFGSTSTTYVVPDGEDMVIAAPFTYDSGFVYEYRECGAVVARYDMNTMHNTKLVHINDWPNPETEINVMSLQRTADGDFYLVYRELTPDPKYEPTMTAVKLDHDLNVIWKRYCYEPNSLGVDPYWSCYTDKLYDHNGGEMGIYIAGYSSRPEYQGVGLFFFFLTEEGLSTDESDVKIRPYTYYPNPTQNELHLQYSPDVTPKQIELYDLQGRLVKTQRSSLESLNLQGLAAGTYTMRVTLEGGKVFSDKVVKE